MAQRYSKLIRRLFYIYVQHEGTPDIIHLHSALFAGLAAVGIKDDFGINFVYSEHRSDFLTSRTENSKIDLCRTVVQSATRSFAVSKALASSLCSKLDIENGSISVMPNSVSDLFLDGQIRENQTDSHRYIHISTLTKNKNAALILKSFARSFAGINKYSLVIAGTGPEEKALQTLARTLGICSQVRFTGFLNRASIRQELENSDTFVLSSNFETFGVALIEAMALGLNVISTRCGGPEEIVHPNLGYLVPKNDVAAMSDAMLSAASNKQPHQEQTLREYCRSRFGPERVTLQWAEIYKNSLYQEI
jgi:glycosyltransferase involved in cell wall biosynthesis